jgi:1-deoxy-D-xylulose-5-phosphate reductoisomerase
MNALRRITILGSTGSIGASTLDVVARHADRFEVVALSARNQVGALIEQCRAFRPRIAVMLEAGAALELERRVRADGLACEVRCGPQALEDIASATDSEIVMAAIVGAAGLRPTLAAARAGKSILLANKESLVSAGPVFMDAVRASGARLLPIDSEHNAIFQALPRDYARRPGDAGVRRIVLTASGGPFRTLPLHALDAVTPDEACAHPNWVMGRKISVDSATMMNKGLEVIEAHWLFNVAPEAIDVIIHPQSVIHSLVEYVDGSVLAQLGNPDMRTPIAYALGFPERIGAGVEYLDLARIGALNFEAPDLVRFPCLRLAYAALRTGGSAPTALNAANEVAVARFLTGELGFRHIPALIEDVLAAVSVRPLATLEDVLEADFAARERAERWLVDAGAAQPARPLRQAASS